MLIQLHPTTSNRLPRELTGLWTADCPRKLYIPDITFEVSLLSLLSLALSIKNESRNAFTSSNVNACCISGVEFTAISRLSGWIFLARSVTLKSNPLSDECVRV